MPEIRRLPGPLGAEIHGLDLSRTLGDSVMRTVADALH